MQHETIEKLMETEYDEHFDDLRKQAMMMSHYKYGSVKDTYEVHKTAKAIGSLEMRLLKYKQTGNIEFLVDVANFAMIEFMYPQHKNAHYRTTSSQESPGLDGMGVEEINQIAKGVNHSE
jgi:hypothetical protein